jgi:hypothetical protein
MPIVIQDLLASDTLSQAVDKINFNFDQLLLNGGGPVGPAGIPGPTGPAGGRGIKGATWYNGTADPNTLIIAGIEEDDYFLQSNGQVWEYNGTVWVQSSVNLIGPTGPSGSNIGFDYIGGYNGVNPPASLGNDNVAFPVPMPSGVSGGANQLTNQGISTVLLGGVGSTSIPPAGITYSSAFQIPDTMAVQLDSSLVSVLVHQKDSSSSAIRFMGGGDIIGEKYEQSTLNNLSNISLGIDDALNINVPKAVTSPSGLGDLIGLNLNVIRKGIQLYAGKQINIISGTDSVPSGLAGEISDVTLTINTSNSSIPAKLSVSTTFASATTLFEMGGNIIVPPTTTRNGTAVLEAGSINLISSTNINLKHSSGNAITILSNAINIGGGAGPINITTVAGHNIGLSSDDLAVIQAVTAIQLYSPVIANVSPIIIMNNTGGSHEIRLENSSITLGGTKIFGNVVWTRDSVGTPVVSSHRSISVIKGSSGLTLTQSPIYIEGGAIGAVGRDLVLDAYRGTSPSSAIEYLRLYTASTDIRNTSGAAGFVGHTVENQASNSSLSGNVGFRVRGVDRVAGNTAVTTRFFAGEETTAVSNRLQYVRKIQNIDPIWAGLSTSAGNGFVIPAASMDATFLDVRIVGNGTARVATGTASADTWDLFIPQGFYSGQRLIVHVIANPVQYSGTVGGLGVSTAWPLGATGNVDVWVEVGTASSSSYDWQKIGRITVTNSPRRGGEAIFELLWTGAQYTSIDYNETFGNTTYNRTGGWMLTNGARIFNTNDGEYRAVQNSQAWL